MNEAQHQRERNIEYLQKMRSLEERTFSNQADDITRMIEKEKEADSGEVTSIQEALGDLKAQLEKCRITNKDLISALDTEKADEELDWLQRFQKRYDDLMCEKNSLQNSVNDKVASNKLLRSKSDHGLRLERMKMPTFSGNIRDYPRFKSDFQKQVMPEMDSPDRGAYALKSC